MKKYSTACQSLDNGYLTSAVGCCWPDRGAATPGERLGQRVVLTFTWERRQLHKLTYSPHLLQLQSGGSPMGKSVHGRSKKHLRACHFLNALETWPRGYYHTSLKSRNNSRHKEKTVPFESQAAWKAGLKLDLCSRMPIRDSVVSSNKICLALHWISDRFVE